MPTVDIRSLRDTVTPLYGGLSVSSSKNALLGRSHSSSTWRDCWKKGDAGELRDIVPASDAPRRLSSPFRDPPRGRRRRSSPGLTDLCVYGRTRVRGWLIGGTHEANESKKETGREKRRGGGSETKSGKKAFVLFSTRRIGCYDNWCNFLDIVIRLIYGGQVNLQAFTGIMGNYVESTVVYRLS